MVEGERSLGSQAVAEECRRTSGGGARPVQTGEGFMALASIFSGPNLLIMLVVVLLLFGNRLPETMRNLGKSMTEFKKGIREGEEDDEPKRVEHE